MRIALLLLTSAALALAGCGGGSEEASEPLQEGVYEYELTEEYLVENGISTQQAENESGCPRGDSRRRRVRRSMADREAGPARAAERTRRATRNASRSSGRSVASATGR